jgi:hypothetical protein
MLVRIVGNYDDVAKSALRLVGVAYQDVLTKTGDEPARDTGGSRKWIPVWEGEIADDVIDAAVIAFNTEHPDNCPKATRSSFA